MTFSKKIYNLRKSKGLSQEELAQILEVSTESIRKWESENVMPQLDEILALSETFGVSVDYLLKDIPENQNGVDVERVEEDDTQEVPISADNGSNFENSDKESISFEELSSENSDAKSTAKDLSKENSKSLKRSHRITAIVLAICVFIFALIIPAPFGTYSTMLAKLTEEPVEYPYVLVHGLGGWGSSAGINDVAPYWGATTGSLSEYLNAQNYKVYEATVGPISSSWDRTCELYAQLMGTTVDYGEAHAKAHNHKRYGRTYSEPLYPGWGEKTKGGQLKKINLIGHSFGGNTIRLLTHLLGQGAKEEVAVSGNETSALFKGGKGNWINSVTTLCSPSNGSTLYYVLDEYDVTSLILKLCYGVANIMGNTTANTFFDFQLEQFGITCAPNEQGDVSDLTASITKALNSGNDNAAYDLSPDGSAQLNKIVETVDSVAYFSYTYCTTEKSKISDNQVPVFSTMAILKPTALLMGRYISNSTSEFKIDETWLPNDGLVNVVSAKHPFDEKWNDFDKNEKIERGTWNVMPVLEGDHGTVIGLNAMSDKTHAFYIDLFSMIDGVKRGN